MKRHILRASSVAILSNSLIPFIGGFHTAVFDAPQYVIEDFLYNSTRDRYGVSLSRIQLATYFSFNSSILYIGMAIGALLWPALQQFGYKRATVLIRSLLELVGCGMQMMAHPLNRAELLVSGRALCGLIHGVHNAAFTVFVNDISPLRFRGTFNSIPNFAYWIGSASAIVVSSANTLGTPELWPYLFFVPSGISLVNLAVYPLYPESPNFLRRKHSSPHMIAASQAKKPRLDKIRKTSKSEQFYFGISNDGNEDVDLVVPENGSCQKAKNPAALNHSAPARLASAEGGIIAPQPGHAASQWQLLKLYRKPFGIGVLAGAVHGLCGFNALAQYFTALVEQTLEWDIGLSQFMAFSFLTLSILAAAVSLVLVKRFGRRPLFLTTLSMVLASTLLYFAVILHMELTGRNGSNSRSSSSSAGNDMSLLGKIGFFLGSILMATGYNMGLSPICCFIASEMVPRELGNLVQGVGFFACYFTSFLTSILFYPLFELIGSYVFLVLTLVNCLLMITFCIWLPETKDRPIVDLILLMGNNKNTVSDCHNSKTNGNELMDNSANDDDAVLVTITKTMNKSN